MQRLGLAKSESAEGCSNAQPWPHLALKDMRSLLQDYVSTLSGLLPSNQSAALSPAADDTVRRLAHEAVSMFSPSLS